MKMSKFLVAFAVSAIATVSATPAFASGCQAGYVIDAPVTAYTGTISASQNVSLYANSYMTSNGGNYTLRFQVDGNLVLYRANGSARWDAKVQNCVPTGNTTVRAVFQSDGNLVIYYAPNNNTTQEFAVWNTNTAGHPNAKMNVQDDGNIVIYDTKVLWALF